VVGSELSMKADRIAIIEEEFRNVVRILVAAAIRRGLRTVCIIHSLNGQAATYTFIGYSIDLYATSKACTLRETCFATPNGLSQGRTA
jgi:hypothetical protein